MSAGGREKDAIILLSHHAEVIVPGNGSMVKVYSHVGCMTHLFITIANSCLSMTPRKLMD